MRTLNRSVGEREVKRNTRKSGKEARQSDIRQGTVGYPVANANQTWRRRR
jgi:hypothetical protein